MAAAALLGLATAASAARLDPPTLTLNETSRASVTVEVHAGPSGAPGGFTLMWMKRSDYDRLGWQSPGNAGVSSSNFYGFPTYNKLGGTSSYELPSNGVQIAEAGDLFDETGVLVTQAVELEAGTEYVFRAMASTDGAVSGSVYSNQIQATTILIANCTFTQGYWKNHPSAWPVSSLTLGTVTYNQSELLNILGSPARGNGLLILAHQLIATKLNIAGGANPTSVAAAIAAADAMIGGLMIPPYGSGHLDPATVNDTAQTLDEYNNGSNGVPHCGTTPSHTRTWGSLKSIYR